jgi:hypothetical protein
VSASVIELASVEAALFEISEDVTGAPKSIIESKV